MISGIATLSIEPPPGSARRRFGARTDSPAVLREFLLGPENQLLRQGIGGLESSPETLDFRCHPLVLFGPTGCGKSQLLHALAATWSRQQPDDLVLLTDAIDFARGYASAVKLDDVGRFQQRHQRAGLVLLDGIDALESKTPAQQQMALIIDHRVRAERPTVVTAQQPLPMLNLLPRLISRLSAGLVVPLQSPAAKTRREIIRRLARQRSIELSSEAERLLVEQQSLTIVQLMGVLHRLGVIYQHDPGAANIEIAASQLQDLLLDTPHLEVEPKLIIRMTAKHFGLSVRKLTGTSRRRMDVLARSLAMYLIREFTGESFQKIGDRFGRRDHTTVMHACRKIQSARHSDPAIRSAIQQLRQRLGSDRVLSTSAGFDRLPAGDECG